VAGVWAIPGYTEIKDLGSGAQGRVVLAVHERSGTAVAIKYLSEHLRSDPEFIGRFRGEARLLAELRDPNLVAFYEYDEGPLGAAIVMELVDGVGLDRLIGELGPTGPEAALTVLKGSLLGLGAAHAAGVVHRDFKPANILVDGRGQSKLADFGIAVREGQDMPAAGTPAYMAPEQWSGVPVTPAADVYAATAVFYECLTAARPYVAESLPMLAIAHRTAPIPVQQVPEPLRALLTYGMAKHPIERPASAWIFLGQLEAVATRTYGQEWERRGRDRLAEMAMVLAALFPLAGGVAGIVTTGGSGSGSAAQGSTRLAIPTAAKAGLSALVCVGILGGTVALAATLRNRDSATRLAAPTTHSATPIETTVSPSPTTTHPTPVDTSTTPRVTTTPTTQTTPRVTTTSPTTTGDPPGDPVDSDDPTSGGQVTLSNDAVSYGSRVQATASGFAPGEEVQFGSDSPLVASRTGTCDDNGRVTVTLSVGRAPAVPQYARVEPSPDPDPAPDDSTSPPTTSPPQKTTVTITAAGVESGLTASAELTVG
jgi:serine/threonine-protein kinase